MIGIDRSPRSGPDRFLYAKLALFFLGAGFFVAGATTGTDWAVGVAIVVLLAGLVLRVVSRGRGGTEDEPPPEE